MPKGLRPDAARPRSTTTTSTRSITSAGPAPGSSRSATGARALCSSSRFPTNNEIYDNVVAMWVPARRKPCRRPARPSATSFTGGTRTRSPGDLALCVATRLGMGDGPGRAALEGASQVPDRVPGCPILATLDEGEVPEPVVTVSRGTTSHFITERSPDGTKDLWRTMFDLDPQGSGGRRDALLPALRRQAAHRDLDLPLHRLSRAQER